MNFMFKMVFGVIFGFRKIKRHFFLVINEKKSNFCKINEEEDKNDSLAMIGLLLKPRCFWIAAHGSLNLFIFKYSLILN